MGEESFVTEMVIPGTYFRVLSEGLISVGGVSTGNIGIVGTVKKNAGKVVALSEYEEAKKTFDSYDAYSTKKFNLVRALEILYRNGAKAVFAYGIDGNSTPTQDNYEAAFKELIKYDVNILVLPEADTATANAVLPNLVDTEGGNGKDMIAVIGLDAADAGTIVTQVVDNFRVITVAPGIETHDMAAGTKVILPANYTAAAVAGLISSLSPQVSPTNKILPGITTIANKFSYLETMNLLNAGVAVLEDRRGIRIVRGLTAGINGPFKQITTRRITDYAKAGIRKASDPFIGKLNNQRVRKALHCAIDGFLTTMVQQEALISYDLQVTATRDDEKNNKAIVSATIRPTFSIDFITVTMVLE